MCGIAGFLNAGAGWDEARLRNVARAMGQAILHRGPDAHGEYADVEAGLGLSHRRLSILDLTEAGVQPMRSHSGRWVIVFNGEIYNFQRVREALEAKRGGIAWRGHSDTEVLVEAIDEWGPEAALKQCDGMFAFAAWHRAERRLVLARDRLGEKPLYWGSMPDGSLLFASELRALYAHPSWHGEISRDALAGYMHYNCIPAPLSVWRHVAKLAPAHWLDIRAGRPAEPHAYWSLADAVAAGRSSRRAPAADEAVWIDGLEQVLGDVVEEEMISDVPLGAFLSGGIDSSLIVSMMAGRATRPVKTFTIGFSEDSFDEARYAREVAAHLKTEHHELYLSGQDALDLVPRMPDVYDEPFADSSQLPTYLVSQFARRHVTVALSGDAGDESFSGYTRYHVGDGFWRKVRGVPHPLRRAVAGALDCVPPRAWDRLAEGLGPLCPALLRASPGDKFGRIARMLKGRSPADFYDELISHWKYPEQLVPGGKLLSLGAAERLARAADNDIEAMMAHDTLAYLPNDILVKVDRAAMAVSLETRAPFLDRRVVEFAWQVPPALKVRDGQGKWILRELLARHVPRPLFERPKQGFGIPLAGWLRGPLREWAESLLSVDALSASGLLDPQPIRRKWQEHVDGRASWPYWLWDVLMFQAWHARYREHIA